MSSATGWRRHLGPEAVEKALAANAERLKEIRTERPRLIVQPQTESQEVWPAAT